MKIKLIISIIFFVAAIAIFVISFFTGTISTTMRLIAAAAVCAGCALLLMSAKKTK